MDSRYIRVILFVFCVVIGLVGATQMKTVNGQHLYVSAKTLTDYETTIKSEEADMDNLRQRVQEAEAKLLEYKRVSEDEEQEEEALARQLERDLNLYGTLLGATDVKGPGITITIDDSPRDLLPWESVNNLLVHDTDLLVIISALKEAGAEAISINGQRLTTRSSVSCSGYTVRINGRTYARPYEIKVIGDPARLSSTLLGANGYGTYMKEDGLIFRINTEEEIFMPGYQENLRYEHMEAMTVDENSPDGSKEENN